MLPLVTCIERDNVVQERFNVKQTKKKKKTGTVLPLGQTATFKFIFHMS